MKGLRAPYTPGVFSRLRLSEHNAEGLARRPEGESQFENYTLHLKTRKTLNSQELENWRIIIIRTRIARMTRINEMLDGRGKKEETKEVRR